MFVSSFLDNIIHEEYDFCGVCYKSVTDERADIDDEVILQENNTQKSSKISDLLSYVLGEDIIAEISMFQTVCLQCVTSAVNSYKFIRVAKDNIQYLTTAVDNLSHCFQQDEIPENLEQCSTLFVMVNPENLDIGAQYYDNFGPTVTRRDALEKFCAATNLLTTAKELKIIPKQELKSPKKEIKVDMKHIKVEKEMQSVPQKKSTTICTLDMVHNRDMSILNCKDCLKEFPSVSNLRNHFLRIHAPKEYKCSECPKSYGSKTLLKAHEADSHIHMVCSECGKSFTSMHTFRIHERTHNLKIICSDCGRAYRNQNTFKKHLDNEVCQTAVRHSPADAKFTCDYCNKKYTQKISLRVHIQYEHLNYKYHECKWCKKKFWCHARLKAHIVKHTKEKNFVCTICSGKFVTKESLLYHTRIHTGERPYPCPFCESRFLSASRRQAHMKSQHTDPTIECDICHSKFKSVNFLIKHKQIHVQSKPEPRKREQSNLKQDIKTYKSKNSSLLDIQDVIEEKEVVYDLKEANIFAIQTDENCSQETVYLEVNEDGEYNIKVSRNIEV